MPLAHVNGVLLYFAHIPKTGGSSVEAYLAAKGKVALLQRNNLGWSRSTAQHVERRVYASLFAGGFYDAGFTIVRDPKDRLVSEYRMRAGLGHTRALRSSFPGARRFERVVRKLAPARAFPSFDDWVPRVFAAYAKNPYLNDNHIRPQVEFVDPAHRLFRFEDGLAAVYAWIDAVTGTAPLPGPAHKRKAAEIPAPCSPATLHRIRDFYAEDYRLLETLPDAPVVAQPLAVG